jgi:hypothetical protein
MDAKVWNGILASIVQSVSILTLLVDYFSTVKGMKNRMRYMTVWIYLTTIINTATDMLQMLISTFTAIDYMPFIFVYRIFYWLSLTGIIS